MRILVIYDLAAQSTRDCGTGLVSGLRSLGHEVRVVPVWQYADYLLKPLAGTDMWNMPEDAKRVFNGTINKLILADIIISEPDAIVVVSGWVVARLLIEKAKAAGIFTALWLTESPYQDEEQAAHESFTAYDAVFCNELSSVGFMRQWRDNVVYLPHSYNPAIHKPTAGPRPPFDVYKCGTGFTERRSVIAGADWSGVRVRLDGILWENVGDGVAVGGDVIENANLPATYSNVPINLNIHRTTKTWLGGKTEERHITHAKSIGPRVYEVLACGGFLLTDHREEMDGFLEDGVHLATFADAKGLGDLARHYLQHGDERARIAAAGRAAVADCTFGRRCEQYILPILETKGVKVNG